MSIEWIGSDYLVQVPLIPIDRWPGLDASYHFHTSSLKGEAILAIKFEFSAESLQPILQKGIEPSAHPSEELAARGESLLHQYQLIAAQLEDPQVKVSVYTSIAGGVISKEDIALRFLQEFVKRVKAHIQNAIDAGSQIDIANDSETQPVTQSMVLSVPFASILSQPNHISPLTTSIAFERDGVLNCATAIRESSTCSETHQRGAAEDKSVSEPTSQASSNSRGQDVFARCFEAAFAGFDGESGMLKMALATDANPGHEDSKILAPWVIRWSGKAGVSVQLQNSPVYFAHKPLSNKLTTHRVDELSYSDVDINLWAKDFLDTVDECLHSMNTPAGDVTEGNGDKGRHAQLLNYQRTLAEIIPNGLTWLFLTQPQKGDLNVAQQQFKKILLRSISIAFSVTMAQFPAEAKIPPAVEESSYGFTPVLLGRVEPPSISSRANVTASTSTPQYDFSDGELKLLSDRTCLTFGVSAFETQEQDELEVPLTFHATQLRLDLCPKDEQARAVSLLLELVLPDESPLMMPVTDAAPAHIPLPLLFYPTPPVLGQHSAYGASAGAPSDKIRPSLEESMKWMYEAQIAHDWTRQDALWLTPIYNQTAAGSLQEMPTEEASGNQLIALFESLARARHAWASLKDLSRAADEAKTNGDEIIESDGDENQSLNKFMREAGNVVKAWENLYKPVHVLENQPTATGTAPLDVYRLVLDSRQKGRLHLFIKTQAAENSERWPTIITEDGNERTPEDEGAQAANSSEGWSLRSYDFAPETNFNRLTFRWGPLSCRDMLTATLRAEISRNANLSHNDTDAVAPQFVYRTSDVRFVRPAIAFIQPENFQPLEPEATLLKTIEAVIEPLEVYQALPLLLVEESGDSQLSLRFEASYASGINTPETGARASIPILLVDNISFPLDDLAANLAREIIRWYEESKPAVDNATLSFALTLFLAGAEQKLPVLQIKEIPINLSGVSNEWWSL